MSVSTTKVVCFKHLACSLLLCALVSSPISQSKEIAKSLTVWKVVQDENIIGRRVAYISDSGIKFIYDRHDYAILYASPDWICHYYNTRRKTIYSMTLKQWTEASKLRFKIMVGNYIPENPTVMKTLPGTFQGHKTQSYIIRPEDKGHVAHRIDHSSIAETNWVVAEDIKVSPRVQEIVGAGAGQYVGDLHFPIDIRVLMGSGEKKSRVVTLSMEKVKVPADFFQPPKDFTKVKSEAEITLGSGLIEDIVDDLGRGVGSRGF